MIRYDIHTDPAEMRRRWDNTLCAMEKAGIDCLVLSTNSGYMNGPFKYLTDIPFVNYSMYALFGKEGLSILAHGSPQLGALPMKIDNVANIVPMPFVTSMGYMDDFSPEKLEELIRKYGHKRIGFVGMATLPANIYSHMTKTLTECEFTDASELVDRLKAVKSAYEVQKYRQSVHLVDHILSAIPVYLRPGKTVESVSLAMRNLAVSLGCLDQYIMVMRMGIPTDKPFEKGDSCVALAEVACPGGFWVETGRVFSLGTPSETLVKAHRDALAIQDFAASLCVPGAAPSEMFRAINEKLTAAGYAPEDRICSHSQSYDIVDRPCVVAAETMPLEENMVMSIHPMCINPHVCAGNTDNFLVTKAGGERLTKISREMVILD